MGALALSAIRKLVSDGAADLSLDCHDCCSTHVVRMRGLRDEDSLSECSFDSGSVPSFSHSSKEMQSVIYVDSRARTSGSDSNFEIELRESLHLSDHGVRLDSIRFTNSFLTTDLGKHVYYKDGAGGIAYFILGQQMMVVTQSFPLVVTRRSSASVRGVPPQAAIKRIHGRSNSATNIMLNGHPCGMPFSLWRASPMPRASVL